MAITNVTLPPPIHAVDSGGGPVSLIYDPPSRSDFILGTTEVTVTASDQNDNTDNCAFFVIVNRK